MKQVACGGTGCAVLNGESHFLAALWEALGRSEREGQLVCFRDSRWQMGVWLWDSSSVTPGRGDLLAVP